MCDDGQALFRGRGGRDLASRGSNAVPSVQSNTDSCTRARGTCRASRNSPRPRRSHSHRRTSTASLPLPDVKPGTCSVISWHQPADRERHGGPVDRFPTFGRDARYRRRAGVHGHVDRASSRARSGHGKTLWQFRQAEHQLDRDYYTYKGRQYVTIASGLGGLLQRYAADKSPLADRSGRLR